MKRICIDDSLRKLAKEFREGFKYKNGGKGYKPVERLKKLLSNLSDKTQKQYVQKIIDDWSSLIVAEPKDFANIIQGFEKIIPKGKIENEKFTVTLTYKSGKKKGKTETKNLSLVDKIVEAMGYKDLVQPEIYPKIGLKLKIKTCVYCNSLFAFYVPHKDKDNEYIGYELDHFKPKSKYPFLSTTFFNLQPCCGPCNRHKRDDEALFNLFTNGSDVITPLKFYVCYGSVIMYMLEHKIDDLDLRIKSTIRDNKLLNNHEKLFRISTHYLAHKDIVAEMIWKHTIYNGIMQKTLREQFKTLGLTESDFRRFIVGNYTDLEDIHRRPLSKLMGDIARQLGLIKYK